MTPSDPTQFVEGVPTLEDFGSVSAAMAGLPDPAVLAKLANQFFRDFTTDTKATEAVVESLPAQANRLVPTTTGIPSVSAMPTTTGIPSVSAMPSTSSLPNATAVPTETELLALSRNLLVDPTPTIPNLAVPQTALPTNLNDFSGESTLSFLQEARSLFAHVPALPVHAVPLPTNISIPTETHVRPIAAGLPSTGINDIPGASLAPLATPQVAGAPSQYLQPDHNISFGFLNEIKSFVPLDVRPTLAPIGSELGGLSANDLSSGSFDVNSVRRDFPILQERVNGRPLIWLDNAATTQKPKSVIDRLTYFYEHENSNIHRAAHTLAARATDAYEAAREKVRRFLNASSVEEIIFVRGATEAINLVAQSWGRKNVQKGDEIVITWLEHHANIVPWQMLCAEKGARLRVAPVDNHGQILLDEYEKLLGPKTKLVSLTHVSNALGTVTPVPEMVAMAHRHGAKVLVDGAQAVSHLRVDMQAYDCDFYVFSGHKVFAPTGIGVVFGKADVLKDMPPWQGGGNMISDVTFEKTVYHGPPLRFEAGTGNIADAVGLGAAIDYLDRIGMVNVSRYEHDLLVYGTEALQRIPGLHLIGTAKEKASVLSFVLDGFRTEDVGAALSREGIAVRSGHHCAQPILRRFGLESTVRPSLAFYNTCEEIDALVNAIWNIKNGRSPGLV